jgi:Mg2+ and Co2+ transporter CorA
MELYLEHFEWVLSHSQANFLAQISIGRFAQGNMATRYIPAAIIVPLNCLTGLFGVDFGGFLERRE